MFLDERFSFNSCAFETLLNDTQIRELRYELQWLSVGLAGMALGSFVVNAYFLSRLVANIARGFVPRKRFSFVAGVSAADLALALVSLPVAFLRSDLRTAFDPYTTGRFVMVGLSVFSVLLYSYISLTLVQFLALQFPLTYRLHVTLRRCVAAIAGFWALEAALLAFLWLYAALGSSKTEVLEVTLLLTDIEGVFFYAGSGVIYVASLLVVLPLKGQRQGAGDRRRRAFFLKLGLHMLLFLVAGLPCVLSDVLLLLRHLSPFIHTESEEAFQCYLAYHYANRRWLRWLDWGLLLTLLRSLLDPCLYLFSERIPPLILRAGNQRDYSRGSSSRKSSRMSHRQISSPPPELAHL